MHRAFTDRVVHFAALVRDCGLGLAPDGVMTLLVTTGTTAAALSIDIASGVYDRFRTLSIRTIAPLAGAVIGDVVRYAVASTVVVGLGLALGFRPHGNALGVAPRCCSSWRSASACPGSGQRLHCS